MINLSSESVALVSVISGIATIIASATAVVTLLTWRKQLLYSPILQAVMDLEDSYELLMCEYYRKYEWFYRRYKLETEANKKPKEYKKSVSDQIKIDYAELISNDNLPQLQLNYQLAYAKADRFDICLSSYEMILYEVLHDFFEKNISSMKLSDFSIDLGIENEEKKRFLFNYTSFKNNGHNYFKIIRKSL